MPARRDALLPYLRRGSGQHPHAEAIDPSGFSPVFAREGTIIPMPGTDVGTLCDANLVSNPRISTVDGSWLTHAYPGGASGSSASGRTCLLRRGAARSGTTTICSAARTIALSVLGDEPVAGWCENVVLPGQATPGPGISGWRCDVAAGFIEIGFTHSGRTTMVNY